MSAGCGVGGAEMEDSMHALKRCGLAAAIWQHSSFEEMVRLEFVGLVGVG